MKTLIASLLLLAGCTSAGVLDPNIIGRGANDVACVLGLASLGVSISSGMAAPAIIETVTAAASGNPGLASACAGLVGNLVQDAQGGVERIKAAKDAAQK